MFFWWIFVCNGYSWVLFFLLEFFLFYGIGDVFFLLCEWLFGLWCLWLDCRIGMLLYCLKICCLVFWGLLGLYCNKVYS